MHRLKKGRRKLLRMIPDYDPFDGADDFTFDEQTAQDATDFFCNYLQFIEGDKAGKPFELEMWQQAIIANLFGWKRRDGSRRYREAFIFVPRKSGKTPLAAGIVLLMAYTDGEPGAQLYSAAGEREQAALTYRHAAGMIVKNPTLNKSARIYRTFKSIEFWNGTQTYKALSSDSDTKHGLNAHLIINDELHIQRNRDLVDTLETSTASRRQPMIIHITTAGWNKETICYEKYEYACKVRDGIIPDGSFLPVIYELKEEDYDKWNNEKVWRKANPNLGVSVSLDYLKKQCQKAQDIPAYENTFRRLHLNQWTEQETRWIKMDAWDKCTREPKIDNNIIWVGGLDMSSTQDLTCFDALGFDADGVLHWHTYPFIPEVGAALRERQDNVPYLTWARQGMIELTPGDYIDHGYIERRIIELDKIFHFKEVAFDPKFIGQIVTNLTNAGIECTGFGQGIMSISSPAKAFETLIGKGMIAHGNHPVMNWAVSNVMVKMDENENIKPLKISRIQRVDPVIAGLMALGRLIAEDRRPKQSVYETRGAFVL